MYNIASEESYQDGQVIFREGDAGDWTYVVLKGSVEISRNVRGRKVVIDVLKEGDVFGELAFIAKIKRTATARAIGDVVLGVLDREHLDNEFNKLSGDFRNILTSIVLRLKKTTDLACNFLRRSVSRVDRTVSISFRDRGSFIKAYSQNLSTEGVFIKTKSPLDPGEEFPLKLNLPGLKEPITVKCKVIWTRRETEEPKQKPVGMGVKFCEMSRKEYQVLKSYLQSRRKEDEANK
nr:TIGR02266 family protein [Desulfobacterales bacterium]